MDYIIFLIAQYGYFFVFLLAAAEGPVVSLVVGFLVYMGYLAFLPAFFALFFGDVIPDTIYYYIGRFGKKEKIIEKYEKHFAALSKNFRLIENLWKEHPRKTMFLGKLAYGLSIPVIVSAGTVQMPYRKFITYTIPATVFQYGLIMTIGYVLGHSYQTALRYVEYSGIFVSLILITFVAGYVFLSKYVGNQIKNTKNE